VKLKVGAVIGGAVGLAGAVAAAGVVHERREVGRERARIDPHSAALFGALPVDRQSRLLTEDGISLYVEEVGPLDAPITVVFVHGFTLNLGSFHFQRLALSEAFGAEVRLVFYDQRSHGRSDKSPSADCTVEQLGRDLATVIDASLAGAHNPGPVVLIGHSMGGMTVMSLADQRPDLFAAPDPAGGKRAVGAPIGSVALINTSSGNLKNVTLGLPAFVSRWSGPVLPVVLRRAAKNAQLVEGVRALGKDLAWVITKRLSFASDAVDPAVVAYCTSMISATPVDVVSDFYSTLMAHDGTLGLMNLIDARVLVFGAEQDALTPLAHAETIAAALPRSELITVADAGHLLMLEYPEVVNSPLVELVAAARGDAGGTARRRLGRASRRAAG
jgi:pimeloyl-ACP methyl ester carboxylesterase